jgi:hypothetical protein
MVKFHIGKCRAPVMQDEDIVYSPNKYRETEGIKEIKPKASYQSQCLVIGTTNTL